MNAPSRRRRSGGWWRTIVVLAVLLLLAWLPTKLFRGGGDAATTTAAPTEAQLRQGEYLARAGDCAACHTAPGGKPFAGGLPIASPVGTIYSTNITPDPKTGIGNYTYGQFERAVRRGIADSGETLYPAMPYPSFAKVSDQDVQALYAYFMHDVAPVEQANRRNGIPWPLSMNWPLTYWRWLFAPTVAPPTATAVQDPALARGEYLVEGLGHCGACHTPRSFTLQEKALSASDGTTYLSGGESDHWIAPSLRGEAASGLGSVSAEELVAVLKTGRSEHSAIFGGMADVVQHSTQYLDDGDLAAIAHFLKSLPPARQEAALAYDPATHTALAAGNVGAAGAQLYLDNCAACHRSDGHGYGQVYPALAGNPVLNGSDPGSVIRLVLHGGTMPSGRDTPTQFSMPAFRERLDDSQLATLLTFVRSSWGNRGGAVDAQQVARMRNLPPAGKTMMTGYDPRARQP
ncbi:MULTISPECIES: c-type cytochrome [Rhodanobacter]|uniref:c-type cytochrome n=1 Tax=Rhodanobacter TaxID=75309 RepID=UPI00068558BE|nr:MULTISPECIES: cytochrome c [Rhodanobacter]TAN16841.1 MAG: cytochrome c [Rhodanobacter sp.]UJJ54350.1 cytochrome c [Rhodanobacter thiooxydans]